MATFTEYVKLITEAGETVAAINKVNEAINKLRQSAKEPINVNIRGGENEEEAAKKLKKEKQQIYSEEQKAAEKRLAASKAIKEMNASQDGPSYEVRYGSRQSIENAGKLNEQLAESTQRINRMADAYKHVNRVAKEANVELPDGLKEKLATQTVNKVEKAESLDEKKKIQNAREYQAQVAEGHARILQMQKAEEAESKKAEADRIANIREYQAQVAEGHARVLQMQKAEEAESKKEEADRISQVRTRQDQEEEGERRVLQMQKIKEAEAEKAKAKQIANVREYQAQVAEGHARVLQMQKAQEAEEQKKKAAQIAAVRERQAQEEEGIKAAEKIQQSQENERIAKVRERQAQEEQGALRIAAMNREDERIKREAIVAQQREQREQERKKRAEDREITNSNRGGWRGAAGEIYRDTRRSMVYGGINKIEELSGEAFKADVARDSSIESLRQAGRSNDQIKKMEQQANTLSSHYRTLTGTELMLMEQHNIGAFGNFDQGMANNELSAQYIATRKGKVGEEKALDENLALLKVGEETGKLRDPGFMEKMYNKILQTAQVEGAQFDPASFITTVRMMKSAKYMLSDDTLFGFMPFMNIMEKAGRSGNELASMFKTMTYSGTSLSKGIQKEIAGTNLSNGKGGYSPIIAEDIAKGDFKGVIEEINKFFRGKGIDPKDESPANKVRETQELAKVYGNQNAQTFLEAVYENLPQFEKQIKQQEAAEGKDAAKGQDQRTIQGGMDAVKAQFDNAAAQMMKPFNQSIKDFLGGITRLEMKAKDNPDNVLAGAAGLAAGGLGALIAAAVKDPQAATNTALLGAIATNTGISAVASGGNGIAGQFAKFGISAIAAYEAGSMIGDALAKWYVGGKKEKINKAYTDPEANKEYNDEKLKPDQDAIDQINANKNSPSYIKHHMFDERKTKDEVIARLNEELRVAEQKLAEDKHNALPYNPMRKLDENGNIVNKYEPDRMSQGAGNITHHKDDPIQKLVPDVLSDGSKHALEEAGRSLSDGSTTLTHALTSSSGEIIAGGSALAHAIASIAAQIAGISIPQAVGGGGSKTTPNVGLSQRGE